MFFQTLVESNLQELRSFCVETNITKLSVLYKYYINVFMKIYFSSLRDQLANIKPLKSLTKLNEQLIEGLAKRFLGFIFNKYSNCVFMTSKKYILGFSIILQYKTVCLYIIPVWYERLAYSSQRTLRENLTKCCVNQSTSQG